MNLYKKIIMSLVIGLSVTPLTYAQLDGAGEHLVSELNTIYQQFLQATRTTNVKNFNFNTWNFMLNTYVKDYVETNGAIVGVQDKKLKSNLDSLLQTNIILMAKIEEINELIEKVEEINRYIPSLIDPSLTESLLKPLEAIDQYIKDTVIPDLEKTNYHNENRKKAKTMLMSAFELIRLMTAAMVDYTSAFIHTTK